MKLWCLLLLVGSFFAFGVPAYAQTPISMSITPSFPKPNEPYTVRIEGSAATPATVTWYVNGIELSGIRGSIEANLNAGGLGVTQKIVADVALAGSVPVRLEKQVTPTRTDLIVTSDTTVPPFYTGRREGSSGSTFTLTALVFEGSPKSGAYTYLWNIDGKNQNGGTRSTSNRVNFTTEFKKEIAASVVVYKDGVAIDEASTLVHVREGEVYFYERNPLRGIHPLALFSPHLFIGEELIVRAESFFVSQETRNGLPSWKWNAREVESSDDPHEMIIQKQTQDTRAVLTYTLRNMTQLLQSVRGTLEVQF